MRLQTNLLIVSALFILQTRSHSNTVHRSFRIDYENDCFLKDGQPFRFVAGSFHYFRALPDTWRQKLRTMRAAGLNAVTTYVEWSLHNPKPDTFIWNGMGDIEQFIRLAAEEDLLVILRPGPYICAERDMGGFPYWLLRRYPGIKMRTYDTDYLKEVRIWYNSLFPRITRYLYGNGGPIIMVQVENEYGSFACDRNYSLWLRDETLSFVGDKAVLFTNDGPSQLPCGKIDNVLATLDFGSASRNSIDQTWRRLREFQPKGPLVNAEYYPGWLTHWQEPLSRVESQPVVDSLRFMLDVGASVNFYMFFGGTNFGFTAGANDGGPGKYQADLTSYDYDAPMDEAGDPTPKYMLIRDAIKDYLPLPNISVPARAPKMTLPPVRLIPKMTLLSPIARQKFGQPSIRSRIPLTFEQIDQNSGFVLYEAVLPPLNFDPSIFAIPKLNDRAIVLIDDMVVGYLSRENLVNAVGLNAGFSGKTVQVLVESQGRINYNVMNDFKGIIGNVQVNNMPLLNWTMTGFPLEDVEQIEDLISERIENDILENSGRSTADFSTDIMKNGPRIFHATFNIDAAEIHDTYINPSGWGKGIIFINGFNLGRYWPLVGPQITLYLPKQLLRRRNNLLILIELQKSANNGYITFSNYHIFNTKIPQDDN
ncbi:beta-galactosidase-like isoform X2 [Contarinia nasturtii]|nr:beta-galactosidase-like isoform X2 [Contarinia nasturtii]XP_031630055.1 beta-galactosidase-like isoform X2 [Contarinia nasturtii]XP_031630056.1 beta-galactosidase-like isoform X2 [Contarinia nasturtii]XP_031630057.1 beta-galactosidase-like isoform X2 [Contarinia nasturtii]XP_031630058.1 beta-galactosidase-like isoform X2 [Contarinia nasturtii]